jgi:hypothetical protein
MMQDLKAMDCEPAKSIEVFQLLLQVLKDWIFDNERFICTKEVVTHPWSEQNPIFRQFLLFLLHGPQAPTPVKARPLPFLSRDYLQGAFTLCDAPVDDVFAENKRESVNVRNTHSTASSAHLGVTSSDAAPRMAPVMRSVMPTP